jgi:hypothetical protein
MDGKFGRTCMEDYVDVFESIIPKFEHSGKCTSAYI